MNPHQNLYVTPSTLEVDYDRNLTELYQAITDQKWDRAISICKKYPVQAATWVVRHYEDDGEIMWRFLPIHSACARQPPAHVVQALLKAYPDGAKCIDDQGMYALHYACGNQASRDVIRLLLVNFPEAAKIPDPRGMLPIHYLACWGPSSVSVVDMLLVANREVANARDEEGNTPLDLAKEGDYPERHAVMSALRKWINDNHNQSMRANSPMRANSKQGYTMDQLTVDINVDEQEEKKDEGYYANGGGIPVHPRSARSMYEQRDPHNSAKRAVSPTQVNRLEDQVRMLQEQLTEKMEKSSAKARYNKSQPPGGHHVAYAESSGDELNSVGRRQRVGTEEEILRLQHEIDKLQSDLQHKDTEERDNNLERELTVDDWKKKYEELEKNSLDKEGELLRDMRRVDDECKDVKKQLAEAQDAAEERDLATCEKDKEMKALREQLDASKNERDGLRMTLGDLMEQHDNFKKKSHNLTDRLGSLSVSLESMMEQQRALTKALQERNNQYRDVFKKRQEKLKELEELEKAMSKDEDKLENSLMKQMKEMEAIAAVIAAARE